MIHFYETVHFDITIKVAWTLKTSYLSTPEAMVDEEVIWGSPFALLSEDAAAYTFHLPALVCHSDECASRVF